MLIVVLGLVRARECCLVHAASVHMHLKFLHGIGVYYSSINIPCFYARFLGLRIDKLRNVCRQNSLRIYLKTLLHLERSCFFIRLTEPITALDLFEDGLITFRLLLLHLLHEH